MSTDLKQIEEFWDNNLCGESFVNAPYLSKEFFDIYTSFRYRKTHHIPEYIDWDSARNKDVLEIGLGIGADATQWASHARSYTGVDLTEESIKAVQMHFGFKRLQGNIMQGNVEKLNLPSNSFDIVYSFGVLHHTNDITAAFKEINRVLNNKGEFILMLYARESFNYWIRIQLYFRLRLIIEIIKNKIGIKSTGIWEQHIKNYKKTGIKYLSWSVFPHHCTDGPDCEVANIFSRKKIRSLLEQSGFIIKKQLKAHLPLGGKYPKFERLIARFIGFHRIIWAVKNNSKDV